MFSLVFTPEVMNWVIIPLLIFFARVIDVSIGTIRVILLSKGVKWLAPILGSIEVLIWLMAVRQVLVNMPSWMCYVAYALGFGMGTLVGMNIEERLRIGKVIVRIITYEDAQPLIGTLRQGKHGVTVIDGEGSKGPIKLIFTVVKKNELKHTLALVKQHSPKSFYTIEDVRYAADNQVEQAAVRHTFKWNIWRSFGILKKTK